MKKVLLVLALTVFSVALVFAGGAKETESNSQNPYEGKTLTISMWGYNMDVLQTNIIKPFEEKYGVKIVLETGNNSARFTKLVARKDNPIVDVAFFAGAYTYKAKEAGILQPYNPKLIPNLDKIMDAAKDPVGDKYGIGYSVSHLGLCYRTDKLPKVTSWLDLLNPEAKGVVSIPTITTTYGPAIVYMLTYAATGDFKDFDAGWAKLEELAPNLLTAYGRSSEFNSLISQEEVYLGAYSSFAWGSIKKTGLPIASVIPKEGLVGSFSTVSIVKGTKNEDLANLYIDFLLSHEVQLQEALDGVDSPVRTDVELTAEQAANLTYGEDLIKNLHFFNVEEMAKNQEAWIPRWNTLFTK